METLRVLASAAAEGAQKAQIRRAISTIKNLELDDDDKYCAHSSSALSTEIMKKTGVDYPSSDDLYMGGIFVFVIANHISYIFESEFEIAAALGTIDFLVSNGMSVHDASLSIGPISRTYNSMVQSSGGNKFIQALGQSVVKWCNAPSDENMGKLIKFYDNGRRLSYAGRP